jgi:hypothetical protein
VRDKLYALCEEDKCVSEWKEDKGYVIVPEGIDSFDESELQT